MYEIIIQKSREKTKRQPKINRKKKPAVKNLFKSIHILFMNHFFLLFRLTNAKQTFYQTRCCSKNTYIFNSIMYVKNVID